MASSFLFVVAEIVESNTSVYELSLPGKTEQARVGGGSGGKLSVESDLVKSAK